MRRIQSKNHKIGIYEINKILLLCFDNKRFVLDDGIHTLAYFHKGCKSKKMFWKILKDDHKKIKFSQMIISKKRSSKMIMDKKRFSQIKTSAHRWK